MVVQENNDPRGALCKAYHRGYIYPRDRGYYTRDSMHDYLSKRYGHFGFLPKYEIGEYTYGQPDVYWYGELAQLKIGKFCSIAKETSIFLGGEHETNRLTTYPFASYTFEWEQARMIESLDLRPSKGDVVIGNDVWIGIKTTILSGVTIGDGAIIGAGSIVAKDIPPYAIYAGNPACFIRSRFNPDAVALMQKIKWWDWPKEVIDKAIPILLSGDIYRLNRFYEEMK